MSVIIGMDPHKRSTTIEIVDQQAAVLAAGRFGADKAGYAGKLAAGRKFADRTWAVEDCNGIGRHIAHRLVHVGSIPFLGVEVASSGAGILGGGNSADSGATLAGCPGLRRRA